MHKSIGSINFVMEAKLKPQSQGEKKSKFLQKIRYYLVFTLWLYRYIIFSTISFQFKDLVCNMYSPFGGGV